MKTLITGIGCLYGILPPSVRKLEGEAMSSVGSIEDAYLEIIDGNISSFGPRESLSSLDADKMIDARGGFVMPTFCDSHSHVVYAGSREGEFRDKIAGLSYEEIAARGGGILNSADLLHETSEDELFEQSMERVRELMAMGTGALEIKSGYGLNTADELKMLRVIRRIREAVPIAIKSSFLGAHAVGRKFGADRESYVKLVCNEMLPEVAREGLADYVDVFCDEGFFTPEDTVRFLKAGAAYGLRVNIHANELALSRGIQAGVSCNALSFDHLERTG
ncbi:MAG: imidazolonepropionase, partial [Bacteroidales bacterium]|nr:imidazolonepropionase [Bacteroidales bacterium]